VAPAHLAMSLKALISLPRNPLAFPIPMVLRALAALKQTLTLLITLSLIPTNLARAWCPLWWCLECETPLCLLVDEVLR
jgi:hypothetical protein